MKPALVLLLVGAAFWYLLHRSSGGGSNLGTGRIWSKAVN